MNDELEKLTAAVCDGRASEEQRARLTELLRDDPAARDDYLRYVDMHAALGDEALPSLESNIINYTRGGFSGTPGRAGFGWADALKLAAVLVLLLGLLFALLKKPEQKPPSTASAASPRIVVATLLFSEDCEWEGNVFLEGERLAAGVLNLAGGVAVLRMDGGAEAVLTGPVRLELESAGSARLHSGEVVIRATDGAEGFTLHTPASEVVDLGTEFAVRVEPEGATEVHVLDGTVECRDEGATVQGDILAAGNAVRFDQAKSPPRSVELNATRFAEVIRRAKPRERRDLMRVYEGFHYEAGRYSPGDIVKGKGWAGPWRLRSELESERHGEPDSTSDMHIVHGKLNVAWPVPGGRLGMLEMPAGKTFRVRRMARPLDLSADEITYFSLMTYEPDHSNRLRTRPNEGVRLTFRSSADYWGQALSFGLGQGQRPHIQNGIGYGARSSLSIPDEQSLLWIGKIVSRRNEEDQVSLRIYGQKDVLDFAEPAQWHVETRGLQHDAKLDLVLLTSQGASPRVVDELRIGPTWRSVVPIRQMAEK